jgi:5-hydroxyisourate hydrolase
VPGGISVHAVDVASGLPARGMRVELVRMHAPDQTFRVAEGTLTASGAWDHPVTRGEGVLVGTHEARFHVGEWLRGVHGTQERFFQEVAVFRFEVLDPAQHYHLPIKFTPWGFALFRGA